MWGPDENVKDTVGREGELAAGELSLLQENYWLQPKTEQNETKQMRHRRKYKLFGESTIKTGILVRSQKCLESSINFGMFLRKLIPGGSPARRWQRKH